MNKYRPRLSRISFGDFILCTCDTTKNTQTITIENQFETFLLPGKVAS